MADALSAVDLDLAYGPVTAVEGADFAVPEGTSLAVIGPNGSGKSTVLRAAAGLLEPRRGELRVPARDRRGGVALVLQTTEIEQALPLTVRDTVRMARYAAAGFLRPLRSQDRRLVEDAMARTGVTDLAGRQLHELSGGQRQRVLVAQGLAQAAELLLLDEPFTGLDLPSREQVRAVVDDERNRGRTVVLSTHDLDDARACDRVLLLQTRQIAFGTPDEVLSDDHLVEAFGSRVGRLADGQVFVDDPHHAHRPHSG